jgi:hypothetical protein
MTRGIETAPVGSSAQEDWPGHEETLGGEKEESSGMIQEGRL